MRLGVIVRNLGPQSTREMVAACASAAEEAGLDDVWVHDHLAIPPDDAAGSGGRYLDPLATLAFLAGTTARIGLGTAVLVLPYRPALPTAKWVATIQELSGNRLRLGVGVGALAAEFRALGVAKSQRGRMTDAALEMLHRCFAQDELAANGQRFLFKPRPELPPIYVGGKTERALERVVRYGDGWIPTVQDREELRRSIQRLHELAQVSGKARPAVVLVTTFSVEEPAKAADQVGSLAELGVTDFIHRPGYDSITAFRRNIESLTTKVLPLLADAKK